MSTAVILAGGKSSRMGKDKLDLIFQGYTLLEAAVNRFTEGFDNVYVSIADSRKYPYIKAEKIEDIYKGCGPISGLHAALKKTRDKGVFLVAADLPYSDPYAAKRIIDLAGSHDVTLMVDNQGRFEPLFAYYKKSIFPVVDDLLKNGKYKMTAILESVSIKTVTAADLGELWDDKLLLNINCAEDYGKLFK